MTIKEFLDRAREAEKDMMPVGHVQPWSEALQESVDVWDNDAVKGYVIKAMRDAKLRTSVMDKVLVILHWAFDEMSVEEAKAYYYGKYDR